MGPDRGTPRRDAVERKRSSESASSKLRDMPVDKKIKLAYMGNKNPSSGSGSQQDRSGYPEVSGGAYPQ